MEKWILAFFTENGKPKEGLTPTIRIRRISDDILLVNNESMIEHGDGFYKYKFLNYNPEENYSTVCDGGDILDDNERFVYGGNATFTKEVSEATANSVWDEILNNHLIAGSTGEALSKIKNSYKVIYYGFGK